MISHVFKKAEEANIGEVIVAIEDQEIVEDVKKNGGQAIFTKTKLEQIEFTKLYKNLMLQILI